MKILKLVRYCVLFGGVAGFASATAFWLPKIMKPVSKTSQALPSQSLNPDLTFTAKLLGASPVQAAQTPTINIQVLGLLSTTSELGSVVLSVDGKPGRAYKVDDKINGQAVVKAIRAQEVVITVNGQDQVFAAPAQPTAQMLTAANGKISLNELAPGGVLGNDNSQGSNANQAAAAQNPGVQTGSLQMGGIPSSDPNVPAGFVPPPSANPNMNSEAPNQPLQSGQPGQGQPALLPVPTAPNPPPQIMPPQNIPQP